MMQTGKSILAARQLAAQLVFCKSSTVISDSFERSYLEVLERRPLLLGWRPLLLGWRPPLLGSRSSGAVHRLCRSFALLWREAPARPAATPPHARRCSAT